MLVLMSAQGETRTPLGEEIQRHLDRREWSIRRLAEETQYGPGPKISHITISRLMRGKTMPTPATLDAIARALDVDPLHLYRLAGIPMPTPRNQRDSRVEYLAQRIDALLKHLRPHFQNALIESVGGIVDAWDDMVSRAPELYIEEKPAPATPAAVEAEPAERRQLIESIKRLRDNYPGDFADLLDEVESERPAATRSRASGT